MGLLAALGPRRGLSPTVLKQLPAIVPHVAMLTIPRLEIRRERPACPSVHRECPRSALPGGGLAMDVKGNRRAYWVVAGEGE